jgi:hypothetical protein
MGAAKSLLVRRAPVLVSVTRRSRHRHGCHSLQPYLLEAESYVGCSSQTVLRVFSRRSLKPSPLPPLPQTLTGVSLPLLAVPDTLAFLVLQSVPGFRSVGWWLGLVMPAPTLRVSPLAVSCFSPVRYPVRLVALVGLPGIRWCPRV